eukprot:TRINITY_DN100683_c0_g1_i1.p1 TRINITY_DN100683_c0_g1~~TRINITY_DN100683_c0_g1_i1.p1  ORF type:complete len:253 (+),score=42.81 TRINITY_DN100683_c0_g1_i1:74-832(+)
MSGGIDVILNVYDLIDQTPICCGFFHTGIEVAGVEYAFASGAGVYDLAPRTAQDGKFRESIVLGSITSRSIAISALDRLRSQFPGDAYSLVFRNCNDFSSAFCKAMLGRDIPGYINRLAKLGRMWPIRLCIPPHLKGPENHPSIQAAQQQSTPLPLFQGSGQSLSGRVTGGGGGGGGGLLARIKSALGWRSTNIGDGDSSMSLIRAGGGPGGADARELRAAAASKRLSSFGSSAEETAESGSRATPMPNPWS